MKNQITAARLREAISNMGITQQELADRSGVGKASISQYLHGTYSPGNIKAGKLAKVLHVDPMWLMGFDKETIDAQYANKSDPLNGLSESKKNLITEIIKEMSALTPDELSEIKNQIDYIIFKRRK